eukprot:gene16783-22970_t
MHQDEPSLLHHLHDIRATALSPEGGISTIIYCAKLRSDAVLVDTMSQHRKVVEQEVEAANITGLLIGQGNCILHLLEGSCTSILRIINNFVDYSPDSAIISANIVYNVEDRPKRYFPQWYSSIIQERIATAGDEVTEENCKDAVHELAYQLLEIGSGLQEESDEGELELTRYSNYIPGKNLVTALSISTHFFSVEEFLQLYFDPYHVDIESEQLWPVEKVVMY